MSNIDKLVFEEALLARAAYAGLEAGDSLNLITSRFRDIDLSESMASYFSFPRSCVGTHTKDMNNDRNR